LTIGDIIFIEMVWFIQCFYFEVQIYKVGAD